MMFPGSGNNGFRACSLGKEAYCGSRGLSNAYGTTRCTGMTLHVAMNMAQHSLNQPGRKDPHVRHLW